MELGNIRAVAAVSIAAAMLVPAAAGATQYLVTAAGFLQQAPTNPPGTIRLELPQLAGQGFLLQFLLDGSGPGTVVSPPGGVGEGRSYFSALGAFNLFAGGFFFTPAAGGSSQLLVLNNVAGNPGVPGSRADQVSFNAGTVFSDGAAIRAFDIAPALGDDIYLSSLAFGRTQQGTAGNPPTMVDSVDFPAIDQLWTSAQPVFFSMQFRQGNPTSAAEQNALPLALLTGGLVFLQVDRIQSAIPEPATWALMIAGFGLVGAAMRRQRRAVAG